MRQGVLPAVFFSMLAVACRSEPAASTPKDAIVIENTGSTNTMGYRIAVTVDGDATYESGDRKGKEKLPHDLAAKLKYDVMMAEPLSHVRAQQCMKPVSFGTSIFISVGAERTQDLSCPASPKGEALKGDAGDVASFLKLAQVPRHPGGGVLPGQQ